MTKHTHASEEAARRYSELKAMLERRREELAREVQTKMRMVRADRAPDDVVDESERTELDAQRELGFALIQLTSETLEKIEAALVRLDHDTYGNCVECLEPISEARLRALPFAARCTPCQGAREATGVSRPLGGAPAELLDRELQ
jgi:DnaK suppressor protein